MKNKLMDEELEKLAGGGVIDSNGKVRLPVPEDDKATWIKQEGYPVIS